MTTQRKNGLNLYKVIAATTLMSLACILPVQTASSQPSSNFAIQPKFDYASPFSEGLARVKVGNKWGFIDKTGKLVIPAKFDGHPVDAPVPLFSLSAMDKHPLNLRYSGNFSSGLAPVKVGNNWGYIDKKGRMVIPPKFACADDFAEGVAAVAVREGGGAKGMYINQKGQTLFTHKFGCSGGRFSQGVATVGEESIIDKRGKIVAAFTNLRTPGFPISVVSENLLAVNNSNGFGFADTKGKIAIQPQFRLAYPFSQGLALAETKPGGSGGHFGFIDKTGRFVIPPKLIIPASFSQDLAPYCIAEAKCGYLHKTGKVVVNPKYQDVSSFAEGLAPVKIGNKWGYIRHPFKL